ncbi:hypothetical protein [Streptomyces sp. NBRC 109706]|uniref:hypothetical protein n=1 Tax=Streptomyces sp. NBRC 109706 TaxID=1550035 RepID=UPI00099BF954|nr:hypothetical protein [Streptomyces sp. NBRC 109706]
MVDATASGTGIDPEEEQARQVIKDCDQKLARYQTTLDAGGDPVTIAAWTNDVRARRTKAQARLNAVSRPEEPTLSRDDIEAMIRELGDLVNAVQGASAEEKTAIYRALGIQGTYHPAKRQVRIEAAPDPHLADPTSSRWVKVRVRGGT